ncbi:hypothetical protein [Lentzea indica]|nr:hypothetical protein [Lentzea indica]
MLKLSPDRELLAAQAGVLDLFAASGRVARCAAPAGGVAARAV